MKDLRVLGPITLLLQVDSIVGFALPGDCRHRHLSSTSFVSPLKTLGHGPCHTNENTQSSLPAKTKNEDEHLGQIKDVQGPLTLLLVSQFLVGCLMIWYHSAR